MDSKLALRYLGEVMEWDDGRAQEEFAWLSLMADAKYDQYQGYSPGHRFLEALLYWLQQFELSSERETAYSLIRKRLIYISRSEILHLVENAYSQILSYLLQGVAERHDVSKYTASMDEVAQRDLEIARRKTLYVALSDGARIDFFRRANEGVVSNEQVVAYYEFSADRWAKLLRKLENDLKQYGNAASDPVFNTLCLIDDFVGSGYSLIREENGVLDGKIGNVLLRKDIEHGLSKELSVIIYHYVASQNGKKNVEERVDELITKKKEYSHIRTKCMYGMVLPSECVITEDTDLALKDLLEKYYDPAIETDHTAGSVRYGYRGCGLPLVLEHNTPNNSLALLWGTTNDKNGARAMRALFPRKQRHH